MRLLNAKTLELSEFFETEVPPYAILSHTWGRQEVRFQDMSDPNRFSKDGFRKLEESCRLATLDGLEWVWVDTCCIDKSSSAELTECINAMFQFYKGSVICYVHLEDLQEATSIEDGLADCRWCTRGWTLQELIAPKKVKFYDANWKLRGSRAGLVNTISKATGVYRKVLGDGCVSLKALSVAQKMSFAAKRQTTRLEDMAYCLLGIFDVNMSLIYGEGAKAFGRLQEEIVKRNNDLTIFAWSWPSLGSEGQLPLFAPSPAAFLRSAFSPYYDDNLEFSVTNKGLLISGDTPMRTARVISEERGPEDCYLIHLGVVNQLKKKAGGIFLRKIGPRLFHRLHISGSDLAFSNSEELEMMEVNNYYILLDPDSLYLLSASITFRTDAIHVPHHDAFRLLDAVPESLWDVKDRMFLRPKPYGWIRYDMALAMKFKGLIENTTVNLTVLCEYSEKSAGPRALIYKTRDYLRESDVLFHGRCREESLSWIDLKAQLPAIENQSNTVLIGTQEGFFNVTVCFTSKGMGPFELEFDISRSMHHPWA